MPTTYPASVDSFTNPQATDDVSVLPHHTQHANHNDAITALEVQVGITGSFKFLLVANDLSDLHSASTARTNLGLGSLATQSGTFSGSSSGTNTGDQDLSSYAPKASPALTGTPTAPTAAALTSTTQLATTAFVTAAVATAVTGTLKFQGATDCSGNPNYPAANKGDVYVVSVAGKIGGASGTAVDVGDEYFATADNAGGAQAAVGTSWAILEHNLQGALLSANNLSDVANAATAVNNLGGATSTGSGGLVRITSPTLVTPALGTPASGVLTNCSGTAASLTAGTCTTVPALTGDVTTTGSTNATTVAKIAGVSVGTPTGTGNVVMSASPTLTGTITAAAETLSGNLTLSTMTAGSILYAGTSGLVSQDNANLFWDATNHRLGVGTTAPAWPVHAIQSGGGDAVLGLRTFYTDAASHYSTFLLERSRGTSAAPTLVSSGDEVGSFQANVYQGSAYQAIATIDFLVDGTYTSGQRPPGRMTISLAPGSNGALTERFRISSVGGLVGINTGATAGAQLEVDSSGATVVTGIFKVAASATADALQILKSDNTVLASVGPTGYPKWAGNTYLASDVTNATATMSNIKTLANCISGVTYSGIIAVPANDSQAAEGLAFDLNGGSATFSSVDFGFIGVPLGATLGIAYSTALGTAITVTTATTADVQYFIAFSGVCNGSGTLILRGAQVSHTLGTATFRAGTFGKIEASF